MEKTIIAYMYGLVHAALPKLPKNKKDRPAPVFVAIENRRFHPNRAIQEGVFYLGTVEMDVAIYIATPVYIDITPLFILLLQKQMHKIEGIEEPCEILLQNSDAEHVPSSFTDILHIKVTYPLYTKEDVPPPPRPFYSWADDIGFPHKDDYKPLEKSDEPVPSG